MKFSCEDGNSTVYKVEIDEESISDKVAELKSEFIENLFVNYDTMEPYLGYIEYSLNFNQFKSEIQTFLTSTNMLKVINDAPRKKNGKFSKGKVLHKIECMNSRYISDFHNTWIRYIVKFKTVSDTEIVGTLEEIYDTPG